jgi:phage shock protein E
MNSQEKWYRQSEPSLQEKMVMTTGYEAIAQTYGFASSDELNNFLQAISVAHRDMNSEDFEKLQSQFRRQSEPLQHQKQQQQQQQQHPVMTTDYETRAHRDMNNEDFEKLQSQFRLQSEQHPAMTTDYKTRADAYGFASPDELRHVLHQSDTVVVDVRRNEEIQNRGIFEKRGRRWVQAAYYSPDQCECLSISLEELLPDKQAPIVVYCKTGHRAARAKKILQNNGYHQVLNAGGLDDLKSMSLIWMT